MKHNWFDNFKREIILVHSDWDMDANKLIHVSITLISPNLNKKYSNWLGMKMNMNNIWLFKLVREVERDRYTYLSCLILVYVLFYITKKSLNYLIDSWKICDYNFFLIIWHWREENIYYFDIEFLIKSCFLC